MINEVETGPNAQNVIWKRSARSFAPMFAYPYTSGDRKDAGERKAIAVRPFEVLAAAITKGGVAELKRPSEDQPTIESVPTVQFILRILGVAKIVGLAVGRDRHPNGAAVSYRAADHPRSRRGDQQYDREMLHAVVSHSAQHLS
jgi:hypothetical protein